ncbi:MAG: AI-2E family transporter [Planctomycetota bacterium]
MNTQGKSPVRTAVEIAVSLLLLALLVIECYLIVNPFISFIAWGAIIAVSLNTPFLKLEATVGGRKKALAIFTIVGLAIVIVPAVLFVETMVQSVGNIKGQLDSGEFNVPEPRESVQTWPVVGEKIYSNWVAASTNLEGWLGENSEQLKAATSTVLSKLAGAGLAVLQFVLATLIAAAMLANAGAAEGATRKFFRRVVGEDQADGMMTLTISTIRSVAVGVLGIAFIQAVAGGIGMVAVGVPAAGLLALIILVVAIAQLPPWLVLLPVIVYVFSYQSTPVAVVFAVWSLIVSFADMALKPLFLGRGVEAPMPVILIGAIGGMLTSGIIGLFVGAVVLAVGYKLFQAWMNEGVEPITDAAEEQSG